MNNPKFIRLSGIAVIIAAFSMLVSVFTQDTPIIVYGVSLLGTLVGFVGIHQYQKDSAGPLSLVSIFVLLLASFLYGTGNDNLGDIAFPLAFLVLGVASYRAGKFPRWASGALILGVIVGLIGSFLPSVPRAVDIIDSLIATAGFLAIGYHLWIGAALPQSAT